MIRLDKMWNKSDGAMEHKTGERPPYGCPSLEQELERSVGHNTEPHIGRCLSLSLYSF